MNRKRPARRVQTDPLPIALGLGITLLFGAWALGQSRYGSEKGGEDETGPYAVVANWPQPIAGFENYKWGSTAGVFAETTNRIFIFQRGLIPPPAGGAP